MSKVRGKNTTPEIAVRRMLHAMGYRFRLHIGTLPGRPDIVFRKRKKVIFVHGCYWHGHNCSKGRLSKSNVDFWAEKIDKNKLRDIDNLQRLEEQGWESFTVWQCEIKEAEKLKAKLRDFLSESPTTPIDIV